MKELKIYKDFAELFKPLPQKELQELEEKLKKKYDGTPLYTWKDIYIVDGHNRYPILKKYNIDFNTERVEDFLGEDAKKSDIMQWMISHQQARRNMTAGELIFANSMVVEEIKKENEEKKQESLKDFHGNQYIEVSPPNGGDSKSRSTNTDNQIAKMSGVGVGTVARYNKVMKSDDEELKSKVKSGEIKVGTAYREIKKKENPIDAKKENNKHDIFVGSKNNKNDIEQKVDEQMLSLVSRLKDTHTGEDNLNITYEIQAIQSTATDMIKALYSSIFDNGIDLSKYLTTENYIEIKEILVSARETINSYIEKMEEKINE